MSEPERRDGRRWQRHGDRRAAAGERFVRSAASVDREAIQLLPALCLRMDSACVKTHWWEISRKPTTSLQPEAARSAEAALPAALFGGGKDERNAGTTRGNVSATLDISAVVSRIRRGRSPPPRYDPRRPPKHVSAAGRRMTGGQAECAFNELELMKRAVAQQAGWSAAWFAFERYERARIGIVRLPGGMV